MKKRYSTLSASEGALRVAKPILAELAAGNLNVEERTPQISHSSNFRCEDCGSNNFVISSTHSVETGHEWSLKTCCSDCTHTSAGYRKEIFKRQNTFKGKIIDSKRIDWFDSDGFVDWYKSNLDFFGGRYKDIYTVKEFEERIYCAKCLEKASKSDWKIHEYNDELQKINVADQIICGDCNHHIEFGTRVDYTDEGESITTLWPCESLDFNPSQCFPYGGYTENWLQRGWLYRGQSDRFSHMIQCYKRLADQQKHLSNIEKSRGL